MALEVPTLFSDISASLTVNPVTGDIAQLDNKQSIRASILNILRTRKGERLFQIVHPSLKPIEVELTDTLSETERGSGGFGSTGK